MSAYEREIESLVRELTDGTISQKEYNRLVRDIERDFRVSGIAADALLAEDDEFAERKR